MVVKAFLCSFGKSFLIILTSGVQEYVENGKKKPKTSCYILVEQLFYDYFLKNELSAHLLIVITSKRNKLETRGWSQIKEVEKIFSDLMYFFKICLLVTNLWCG